MFTSFTELDQGANTLTMLRSLPLFFFAALGLTACFDGNSQQYDDEAYGDDYYGDETYGDDYYGDETYGGQGSYGEAGTSAGDGNRPDYTRYDQQYRPEDREPYGDAGRAGAHGGTGAVQIMDVGLGVVGRTYTSIPAGYSVRGQQMTDPAVGFGGDCFIEISGPNGAKFIETAPATTRSGLQGIYTATEQSIMQGLQRAGVSGRRTGAWVQKQAPQGVNMLAAQAPFTTSDGLAGFMQAGYMLDQSGSGMSTPMVFFCRPADEATFMQGVSQLNGSRQNNPQWSARQRQAAQGGIATLNGNHRKTMAAIESTGAAGRRAHESRMRDSDASHARFMEGFRGSGSTSGGYNSNGSGDRGHDAFIDAMTETERYHDPNSGYDRRLDAHPERTFTDGQGNWRQTDDAFADPNAWQGNWTEQRPVDY